MSVRPMDTVSTIDADDTKNAFSLLGRLASSTGSTASRRRLFADELAKLVGADAWSLARVRYDQSALTGTVISFLSGGVDEAGVSLLIEGAHDISSPPPETRRVLVEMKQGAPATRRRCDWFEADEYRATSFFERYRRPIGLDDALYSVVPLESGDVSELVFYRREGKPGFSDRDRAFVHMVQLSVTELHTEGPEGVDLTSLSPRMRTVCALLLQGRKRRQIAEQLGITEHTARDYMRGVYRHFGVGDHVALMSLFVLGDELPADPVAEATKPTG